MAVAAAAGALIHNQCAVPKGEATLDATTEVTLGVATVAVEHQFHGCAGGELVVACPEGQTVVGADGKILMGKLPGLLNPLGHDLPEGFVNFAGRDGVFLFAGFLIRGYMKG